jgi:hypothetical protein
MHWILELSEKERLLRKDFENLSSIRRRCDLVSFDAHYLVMRRIKSRIREIQGTIDLQLSQRSPAEKSAIAYQVDLKLPIYSHLNKLLSMLS